MGRALHISIANILSNMVQFSCILALGLQTSESGREGKRHSLPVGRAAAEAVGSGKASPHLLHPGFLLRLLQSVSWHQWMAEVLKMKAQPRRKAGTCSRNPFVQKPAHFHFTCSSQAGFHATVFKVALYIVN